jgi:hypothetical protein
LAGSCAFFFRVELFFAAFLLGMTRQNNIRAKAALKGCSRATEYAPRINP